MTPEQRTIRALVEALEGAAQHIRALGCTCITPDHPAPFCTGDKIAREYEALARRVRRRTATQEPRREGSREESRTPAPPAGRNSFKRTRGGRS